MQLPRLDLSALPNLDSLTGAFGSLFAGDGPISDDTLIVLMVFVYDTIKP